MNVKNLNEELCVELLRSCHNNGPQSVILICKNGDLVVATVESGYKHEDYKAYSNPTIFADSEFSKESVVRIINILKDAYEKGGYFSIK